MPNHFVLINKICFNQWMYGLGGERPFWINTCTSTRTCYSNYWVHSSEMTFEEIDWFIIFFSEKVLVTDKYFIVIYQCLPIKEWFILNASLLFVHSELLA